MAWRNAKGKTSPSCRELRRAVAVAVQVQVQAHCKVQEWEWSGLARTVHDCTTACSLQAIQKQRAMGTATGCASAKCLHAMHPLHRARPWAICK